MAINDLKNHINSLTEKARREEWDGADWAYIDGLNHILDNALGDGVCENYLDGINRALELLAD